MPEHQHVSWVEKKPRGNCIQRAGRARKGASTIGIVLVVLFFYAHQAWNISFSLQILETYEVDNKRGVSAS
jgi:hypothetical protein